MIIRQILRHSDSGMWAYVERSGSGNHFTILGGKEFTTKEEAEDFAKGFALDSYTYTEPEELKLKKVNDKKARLISEIQALDEEAGYGSLQEEAEQAAVNYADLEDNCWSNDYNGFMAGAKYILNKYGLS